MTFSSRTVPFLSTYYKKYCWYLKVRTWAPPKLKWAPPILKFWPFWAPPKISRMSASGTNHYTITASIVTINVYTIRWHIVKCRKMQNINKRDIVSVAIFTTILVTNPRLIIQWSCATTWFFFKSSNVKVLIVGFFNLAEKKSGLRFYEMYYFWLWQIWYILIYRLARFNLLILYFRTKAR